MRMQCGARTNRQPEPAPIALKDVDALDDGSAYADSIRRGPRAGPVGIKARKLTDQAILKAGELSLPFGKKQGSFYQRTLCLEYASQGCVHIS